MRAYGDLERIRTPNRQSRNLMFYPVELLGLKKTKLIFILVLAIILWDTTYITFKMALFLRIIYLTTFNIISCLTLVGQDIAIGQWATHQSYNSATHISESANKIYCVSSKGLFYINKYDQSMRKLSKNTGLSDFGIKKTAFCQQSGVVVVVYENCNIDLITQNEIININDIKRTEMIGEKQLIISL